MPHLLDVLPLEETKGSAAATKSVNKVLTEAQSALASLTTLGGGKPELNGRNLESDVRQLLTHRINEIRTAAFKSTLSLPKSLISATHVGRDKDGYTLWDGRRDSMSKLALRSKTTLKHLRHVADCLGLVVMPYNALDVRSLKAANYTIQGAAVDFVASADELDLAVYAIAPLKLFSVLQLVNSESNSDSCYSKHHSSTLDTIALQLPLFRTMKQAMGGLDARISALEKAKTTVESQIVSLTNRLTTLEEKVANELKLALEARLKAEQEAIAATERVQAQAQAFALEQFYAEDPLLFAVPRDTNIETGGDATIAVVGPAWGPDFSDALLMVSGLSVVAGQRKALMSQSNPTY